jgi:nitrogen fixation NifU-like protein
MGEMKDADAVGEHGNPTCGDLMYIYIKVDEKNGKEVIKDISFQTFGCAAAIATSSMVTELAKGKSLEDASNISRDDVADSLDGLPPIKLHCSNLAADALKDAIKNYLEKKK